MARIRAAVQGSWLRVKIAGRLTAADMGRLEHACAPALARRWPNLELDLRRVTDADPTAAAVIRRFRERGVRLLIDVDGGVLI